MSKNDTYYAYVDGRDKWLADNPGKTARDFEYAGVDVQDRYVDPEMEKAGYKKDRYIGAGAWEWVKA
jgi:hypothetical protein